MENFKRIFDEEFKISVIGDIIYESFRKIGIFMFLIIISSFITFTLNPTESMYPVIKKGDILIGDRHFEEIKRGDIVLFRPVAGGIHPYSKRVIGLPGEKIEFKGQQIYINDIKYDDPHIFDYEFSEDAVFFIGEDEHFVVGDNRGDSYDSRDFGPIKTRIIMSKVFHILDIPGLIGYYNTPKDFR